MFFPQVLMLVIIGAGPVGMDFARKIQIHRELDNNLPGFPDDDTVTCALNPEVCSMKGRFMRYIMYVAVIFFVFAGVAIAEPALNSAPADSDISEMVTTEQPAEQPQTDQPVVEQPQTDQPVVEQPQTDQPVMEPPRSEP